MITSSESVIHTIAPWLEHRFKAPVKAIIRLNSDDDWTFVIKTHALIEAALNTLLIASLGEKMRRFIEPLETGNPDSGKIAWASALEILDKNTADFIRVLGRVRNKLVHKIENADFTFSESWKTLLDEGTRKKFGAIARQEITERVNIEGGVFIRDEIIVSDPRVIILILTIASLAKIDIKALELSREPAQSIPKE